MRVLALVLVFLVHGAVADAQSVSRESLSATFGFPETTSGRLDIRMWLGGGITVPESVYRIYEGSDGKVYGQGIRWLELGEDRKQRRRLMRLMRRNCRGNQSVEGSIVWCKTAVEEETLRVTLADLQPGILFSLSDSIDRDCGWSMEDGETVTLELLRGQRRHVLSLGNPDFCCTDAVCVYLNHARDVLQRRLHLPEP